MQVLQLQVQHKSTRRGGAQARVGRHIQAQHNFSPKPLFSKEDKMVAIVAMAMEAPPVAGVLDKPFSQLTPLSGVAIQARQST
jgi:hypothetical protein